MMGADNIKNPTHYGLGNGIEAIDVIRVTLGSQFGAYCRGNMLKYQLRAGRKGAEPEDIGKAEEYARLYRMHEASSDRNNPALSSEWRGVAGADADEPESEGGQTHIVLLDGGSWGGAEPPAVGTVLSVAHIDGDGDPWFEWEGKRWFAVTDESSADFRHWPARWATPEEIERGKVARWPNVENSE